MEVLVILESQNGIGVIENIRHIYSTFGFGGSRLKSSREIRKKNGCEKNFEDIYDAR